ncbi:MAG: type II secretion system protein [Microgenomates group bacterium]
MKKSFTLIELLVVIALIGFLSSLILGNFFTSLRKGRDARRKSDLEQIQRALEMYYEDNRAYPTKAPGSGFVFGNEFSLNGKVYMKKVPNDPVSSKTYQYDYDSVNNGYKLYACLENDQQILPYSSALTPEGNFNCNTQCFAQDGQTRIACIWGVSSSNVNP